MTAYSVNYISTRFMLPIKLILLICTLALIQASQFSVSQIPDYAAGDSLEIYFLESPFPFNAPESIQVKAFIQIERVYKLTDIFFFFLIVTQELAGRTFNEFALIHSGIGLWHLESDEKISIEFYADNYVDSLFPVIAGNGSLVWNNKGDIVVCLLYTSNNISIRQF